MESGEPGDLVSAWGACPLATWSPTRKEKISIRERGRESAPRRRGKQGAEGALSRTWLLLGSEEECGHQSQRLGAGLSVDSPVNDVSSRYNLAYCTKW